MNGEAKEEIRARLAIEDVIGEYVQLKRAGRNFKGLSPFGDEKTPSFVVSPDKQIWHDFSANRGGDVFSFVMEVEGIDFRTALEQLARRAGVDLSMYQTGNGKKIAEKKQRLLEANRLAARYFQECMVRSKRAQDYIFVKRKLNKKVVSDFAIGYAPDGRDALVTALEKRGFSAAELKDAGLTNRFGGDSFRGRMTVPLMDPAGQVIGFTGRILADEPNAPKYLNTPGTLIYDKSRHVFGLSQAKEAIRASGFAVIVEGNLDVVSSHQAGVVQVVATAGTAMTEHHLKLLERQTADIRLCFDGDSAGIAATERAITLAADMNIELSIITLPDSAKDPDELIQHDPELWRQAINKKIPAAQWVIEQYAAREDLTVAEGKRRFTTASLRLIARLADVVEREHYETVVANFVHTSQQSIHTKMQELGQTEQKSSARKIKADLQINEQDTRFAYQDDLLALATADTTSQHAIANLDISLLVGDKRQKFAQYLVHTLPGDVQESPKELAEIADFIDGILVRFEEYYASWNERNRAKLLARLIKKVNIEKLKHEREELVEKIRDLENAGEDAATEKIRANELIKLIGDN